LNSKAAPRPIRPAGARPSTYLQPDAAAKYPYRPRKVNTRLHIDGSVVDQ